MSREKIADSGGGWGARSNEIRHLHHGNDIKFQTPEQSSAASYSIGTRTVSGEKSVRCKTLEEYCRC